MYLKIVYYPTRKFNLHDDDVNNFPSDAFVYDSITHVVLLLFELWRHIFPFVFENMY